MGGDQQTLTASFCTEGRPRDFAQALGERASDPGDLEGGEGSYFQMLLANRSCCVSVPPCPGLHVPPGECSLLPSSTPWQQGGGWAPASLASKGLLGSDGQSSLLAQCALQGLSLLVIGGAE